MSYFRNINEKLLELSKSLKKLEIRESEILTAKSKQKYLHSAIEKVHLSSLNQNLLALICLIGLLFIFILQLSHFQKEIQILRRHNEIFAPMNSPNNISSNILS
jgi:hypothetical protein